MEHAPTSLLIPFAALVQDKEQPDRSDLWMRLGKLPLPVREFATSLNTARTIQSLVEQGVVPESHAIAIARLVAFVVLGDVSRDQIVSLLQRLDVPSATAVAEVLQRKVFVLLDEALERVRKYPGSAYPERTRPPQGLPRPVPPLMVRRPTVGPPPRPPAIIDLRKPQP